MTDAAAVPDVDLEGGPRPPAGPEEGRDGPLPGDALYPAFLKLAGLPVVVVGGGTVAAQKLDGLLAAGARVTVIAPRVADARCAGARR